MRPKSTVLAPVGTHGRANDPTDPEAIVRVLFEKSPLLIYIADLDFKIVLINRALREITGYDTSDCRNVAGLLEHFYPDPDYRRLVAGIHESWHRNEHIRDTELVASLKDGGQRTISWSTSRLRVGRGPTTGFIAVGIDVTTRRNLQQWVSLFQRSLQHLNEGVVLTDPTGSILAWSSGAERMLGHADDAMQGRPLKDLYLRGERELIARTVDRAIEAQGQYGGEVELEHADGSTRIMVFKQHRLDGDAGPLARLTLLTEPQMDEELESRLADSQLLAVQLQEQLERDRSLLAERDRLLDELAQAGQAAAAEAVEARTRAGELEQILTATENAASAAQGRLAELERALASVDTTAPARVVELERALATTGTAASEARARAGELERALADSHAAVTEARSRVVELEQALASAEATVATASSRAEREATDTAVTVAIAQGEAADAQDALFETLTRLEETNARAARAEQQVVGLEADLSMLAEQVGEVEQHAAAQVEEARSALEEATVKLTQAATAAEDATSRAAALEAELTEARGQAGAWMAELAQARQQADARGAELENELALVRRQAETRESQLEHELAAARDVASTAPAAQARAKALAEELEQTRQRSEARTAELDARLAEARKEAEALPGAQARVTELEEELRAARERVDELETALDGLRTEAADRQAELEGALDGLRTEAAERQAGLEAALEEARAKAGQHQAELEEARAGADEHRAELTEAAQQADGRVAELETALEHTRQAGHDGDRRVAEAEAARGQAEERAEALRDQLDDVRRATEEVEARLRGELDDVRRVAEQRIEELEAELAGARERAAEQACELEAARAAGSGPVEEPTDAGEPPTRDERVVELEAELEEARGELTTRSDELAQAREEAEQRAEDLQAEVDRLLEAQKTAVTTPVVDSGDAAARIAELEANLKEAKRQAAVGAVELATKLARARSEAEKLQRQLEETDDAGEAADGSALAGLKAALAEAEEKLVAAQASGDRVPGLEARITELEAASEVPDPRIVELDAELVEARRKVDAQAELIKAGDQSRLAAERRAEEEAGGRAELQTRLVDADMKARELESQLAEAKEKAAATAEEGDAGLTQAREAATGIEEQLRQQREEADREAAEAAERWVQQRSALEEQHRTDLADVQMRAADERQALEAQLSKDILAAEERAEADRQKMLGRHEQERKEWEDAAAIARAEAESRLRQESERLTARLDASGSLQPYLSKLGTLALAAADVEGRVSGWSGGASDLDVRDELDALGAFLHKDVLRLEGVDWKTLLGKVVVEGRFDWEGTLVVRGGQRKQVQVVATLVRDAQNQPIGVIELIREPRLEGSLEIHAHAAVARLAMPLHGALETRAVAGLKNNQRTSAAVKDLLLVCRAVHASEAWEDVENAARRVDLGELVDVSEDLVRRSEDAWRELRATIKDLQWLEDVIRAGETSRHRWNELVSRCLHAIEEAGGRRARRSFGNQVFVEGRGDHLVPLLVTLFAPIARAGGEVEVTTATGDQAAHVQVAGVVLEPSERALAGRLAILAGGELAPGATVSLSIPLELPEEATAAIVESVSGEDTRPTATPVCSPALDSEETVPPSAGLDIAGLVEQHRSGDTGFPVELIAGLEDETPEVAAEPAPEEADRQTQPGMPSVLVSSAGGPPGPVKVLGGALDGAVVLEAGDDAIMADPDEIRAAIEADDDGGADLPDIDELEQLFDAAVGVSPSVLATADEMEAYVAEEADPPDELADGALAAGQMSIPPSADVKTDAGLPHSLPVPEPQIQAPAPQPPPLPEDASVTDTGDKMSVVVKKATKPARSRPRTRKKGSRSRKKRS